MTSEILFRKPVAEDAMPVNRLIADSPPLDTNSVYCNLLQCTHFSDTCIIATRGEDVVGFVSSYKKPGAPDCLFVWQAVVSKLARGEGLASRMLGALLDRAELKEITSIETTITEDNSASWALFHRLADKLNGTLSHHVLFDKDTHFEGKHDSEILVQITDIKI